MKYPTLTEAEIQEAAEILISYKMASVQLLQRRLNIQFNRSAELMEALEDAGIVGPFSGKQMRKLLVTTSKEAKENIKNLLSL